MPYETFSQFELGWNAYMSAEEFNDTAPDDWKRGWKSAEMRSLLNPD